MKKYIALLAAVLTCTFAAICQNAIMQGADGKYGVTSADGRWIIPAKFQHIKFDDENEIYECTMDFNGNYTGFYSKEGKQLTQPVFYGQLGFITKQINEKAANGKLRYIYVSQKDAKNNIHSSVYDIDMQKLLVPFTYYNIQCHEFISARPERDSFNHDVYDLKGNQLLSDVSHSLAMKNGAGKTYIYFSRDKLRGVYDPEAMKVIFSPREVALVAVTDDDERLEVQIQHKPVLRRTFYDRKTGKEIVPMKKYETADYLGDGLYRVYRNGKAGLFYKGKEIVECTFDEISNFEGGVAQFEKNGEVRLIKNPLLGDSGPEIKQLIADAANKRNASGPAVSRYPAAESDVDKNIPSAKGTNENLFAFIIANENYPDAPVPYALNDGRAFRKYCEGPLGVPQKNITMLEDATYGSIVGAVEKLKKVADAYDGNASVIVYYAGHGFPDEKQQSAYLLPIDGNGADITTTGFSLADFYKVLGSIKLKSAAVFLDACFSGTKREDEMLAQARGVAIKVKEDRPGGNMVVFTASQGDETAHQMEETRHGLFTYYLLKGLQEQGGDTTMGDLSDYVTKQVRRQSVVINDKRQTPSVVPSAATADSWRSMRLGR